MLTAEGMAVSGGEFLLMPEDDPSRVFVHKWTGAAVPETAPRAPERAGEVAVAEADTLRAAAYGLTAYSLRTAACGLQHGRQ